MVDKMEIDTSRQGDPPQVKVKMEVRPQTTPSIVRREEDEPGYDAPTAEPVAQVYGIASKKEGGVTGNRLSDAGGSSFAPDKLGLSSNELHNTMAPPKSETFVIDTSLAAADFCDRLVLVDIGKLWPALCYNSVRELQSALKNEVKLPAKDLTKVRRKICLWARDGCGKVAYLLGRRSIGQSLVDLTGKAKQDFYELIHEIRGAGECQDDAELKMACEIAMSRLAESDSDDIMSTEEFDPQVTVKKENSFGTKASVASTQALIGEAGPAPGWLKNPNTRKGRAFSAKRRKVDGVVDLPRRRETNIIEIDLLDSSDEDDERKLIQGDADTRKIADSRGVQTSTNTLEVSDDEVNDCERAASSRLAEATDQGRGEKHTPTDAQVLQILRTKFGITYEYGKYYLPSQEKPVANSLSNLRQDLQSRGLPKCNTPLSEQEISGINKWLAGDEKKGIKNNADTTRDETPNEPAKTLERKTKCPESHISLDATEQARNNNKKLLSPKQSSNAARATDYDERGKKDKKKAPKKKSQTHDGSKINAALLKSEKLLSRSSKEASSGGTPPDEAGRKSADRDETKKKSSQGCANEGRSASGEVKKEIESPNISMKGYEGLPRKNNGFDSALGGSSVIESDLVDSLDNDSDEFQNADVAKKAAGKRVETSNYSLSSVSDDEMEDRVEATTNLVVEATDGGRREQGLPPTDAEALEILTTKFDITCEDGKFFSASPSLAKLQTRHVPPTTAAQAPQPQSSSSLPPQSSSTPNRRRKKVTFAVVTPTKSESSNSTKTKRVKRGDESDDDVLFDEAKSTPAASRRILHDEEDEFKKSKVAPKKRRIIFDDKDDQEDAKGEKVNEDELSINCRGGVTVINIPPSALSSTLSSAPHELIQFHLPNTTVYSTSLGKVPSSSLNHGTGTAIIPLGSIEAVDLLLRHCNCNNQANNNLLPELDPILKAFEAGILDVSLNTNTTTTCGYKVVVSINLRLDCCIDKQQAGSMVLPPIPTPHKLPGNNSSFSQPYLSYTLAKLLGTVFSGSIFEDVATSLDHSSQQKSRANNESSVITAKMVYSVVDNVHAKEFEQGVGGRNSGESSSQLKIPGLVPTLRPYQEAAVRWMLKREGKACGGSTLDTTDEVVNDEWELCWYVVFQSPVGNDDTAEKAGGLTQGNIILPLPEWKRGKSSPDECRFLCNPFSGWVAASYEDAKSMMLGGNGGIAFRGGILAESMGLGKSVEVLACIMANPRPSASVIPIARRKVEDGAPSGSHDTSDAVGYQAARTRRTTKPPSLHHEVCICGRSASYNGCLSWVVCEGCGGAMHGKCAGFESEEELFAKTIEQYATGARESTKEHCPSCVAASVAEDPSTGIIESRATLIVTPPAILTQWQREVNRHTNDITTSKPLRVAVYPGVKDLCSAGSSSPHDDFRLVHPKYLADADIVLVTFQSLMSDLGHSDDNPFAGFGARGGSRLRSRKRYKVVPSPLTSIKWWRVALDEAQRVETPTAASARMAQKLLTDKRWCVSGTPIGQGKLEDLSGLTVFLSMKPFDEKSWFSNCFSLSHGDALKRLSYLLKDTMWRSTKANRSVREQMSIPEQEERKVFLQFSSVERYFYDIQREETSTAVAMWTSAKGSNSLSHSLQKLRAACCHPQVGASGVGDRVVRKRHSATVLTMDQILQKLIDDAKLKCEEAQRSAILHTNALACLTKLKAESDENDNITMLRKSVKLYEEALKLADTNAEPSEIDASAVLSGSKGFCSTQQNIDHGPAILRWQVKTFGGQNTEKAVWSNISFVGPAKTINCIQVRSCDTLPSELQGEAASGWTILKPKECVLQMSSAAIGGAFVDVCTFFLADNDKSTNEWQVINGFHAKKSKGWRLSVRSLHNLVASDVASLQYYLGLDVQLFEPEITADNLQRMHILHNASIVLSTIMQVDGCHRCGEGREQLKKMEREAKAIHDSYMGLATSGHRNSKLQFDQASKAREKCDVELSSLSADSVRPWYEDVFAWCAINGDEVDHYDLVETVTRDLTVYYENFRGSTQPDHILVRRGKFPSYNSVDGLHIALAMRIEQGKEQVGLTRGMDRTKCLEKVRCLTPNPDGGEVYENSHCRSCREDWEQTGPVCSHCHLELELFKHQRLSNDPEIYTVLRAVEKFARSRQSRKENSFLKALCMRSGAFFEVESKAREEIESAKLVWKAHFDLLSDIDELNQCKRAMRLRADGEELSELNENEAAFIVDANIINADIKEHELKQANYMSILRRAKDSLRYLKNQRIQRTTTEASHPAKCLGLVTLLPLQTSHKKAVQFVLLHLTLSAQCCHVVIASTTRA